MSALAQLYRGREEAPVDDQLYDFSRQKKQADLLEMNCNLLEKKLLLCSVKTLQAKCQSTFLAVVISGAKDIFTLPSSTSLVYVKVKCGEAVFHTHHFEKDATDWASAPMEISWNEVPTDKILSVSIVDQTGEELAKKEIEVDLEVGHGFDRWVTLEGSACLRLQIEHKGIPSTTALGDLEADIADLVARRRHLKATAQSGLPPMSYATYTTMVAEVERRLCDEVERLRAAVHQTEGRVASGQDTGLLRIHETGRSGPVSTYIEDPGHAPADTVGTSDTPIVQSLLATLTGRNRVIRQLQDTLAGIEAGEPRNVSETILLLASQLEERETTLAQLKADLPPLSLSALVIDQSNVINTLLAQLHKAIGSLVTANQCVERLTGQATLYGGDVVLQELVPPLDPIMTPPQIAALLTRYDEQVQRVRELEALVAEYEAAASGRDSKVRGLHAEVAEIGDHAKDVGVSVARLCEQFNDSLRKLSDVCFFLAGESEDAKVFQTQMPAPIEVPSAGASLLHLANTLDAVQARLADAHLLIYDEVKSSLPQMERLRFIRGGEVRDQQWRKMELKLLARDMDFDDLLADHEALLVALATARQQLAAPIVVPQSDADQAILDACDILLSRVPEAERAAYLVLTPHRRLLALLQDGVGSHSVHSVHPGPWAIRITPLELRGLSAESPYIVARLGNAVQQTPAAAPNGRWNSPMTFALDGPARNLEISIHDRTRAHPLGRTTIHVDQFPHGVPSWVALDDGGDVRLQLDKCRLTSPPGQLPPGAGHLDGIAQKLENTADVLSRGMVQVVRPSHVTPAYLHKLADLLWDLAHHGAPPMVRPPSHGSTPRRGSVPSHPGTGYGDEGLGGPGLGAAQGPDFDGVGHGHLVRPALPAPVPGSPRMDPTLDPALQPALDPTALLALDPTSATLQFLMRSRAGLIRRIWACLQICKVCNNLSGKHHALFSQNKGHRMEVGQFKAALEDLSRLLGEVGTLEDGLAWIVGNYFTDTEKRDLGTSPHLYPPQDRVVRALPGLIESTDIIEARRISPTKRRPPAPGSPYDRRDFLKRLQDAHITVLDSKDGAMDGRYFGHDLQAVQHLDGEVHGIARRRLY